MNPRKHNTKYLSRSWLGFRKIQIRVGSISITRRNKFWWKSSRKVRLFYLLPKAREIKDTFKRLALLIQTKLVCFRWSLSFSSNLVNTTFSLKGWKMSQPQSLLKCRWMIVLTQIKTNNKERSLQRLSIMTREILTKERSQELFRRRKSLQIPRLKNTSPIISGMTQKRIPPTTSLMMTMRIKVWVLHITGHKRILLSNTIKRNGAIERCCITTTHNRVGNQWRRENQGQILELVTDQKATNQLLIIPLTSSIALIVSAVNSRQILTKPTESSKMSTRITSLRCLNKVQTSKLWRGMLIMSRWGSKQLPLRHHMKNRLICPNNINTA